MSLFSWMRRSNGTGAQPKDKATPLKTTGAAASHTLIGELLCHLEEHGHMATEQEQEQRPLQSGRGLYWFEKYPKLRNLISISELQQLELLCSQIPHSHAATVLSRYRSSTLTLVCLSTASSGSSANTRPDSGLAEEKTQRGREAGRAAKEAIMCYCHRAGARQSVNMWRWRTPHRARNESAGPHVSLALIFCFKWAWLIKKKKPY